MSEVRIKSFCRESEFIDESSCCDGDQTIFGNGVNGGDGGCFEKLDPVGYDWANLNYSGGSNPFEEIPDSSVVLDDSVMLKDIDNLADASLGFENLDEVKKSEKNRRKKDRRKQKKLEEKTGTVATKD
jgi:hypothetical protein